MSRGGLYAAIENETLTINNLEKIAKVFDVPVISFFEDQPGGMTSISKFDLQKIENEELKRKNDKLELEKDNLILLIEFIKNKNLLDERAINNLNSPPKSMYHSDGGISLDYLAEEMGIGINEGGSISQVKFEQLIRKMKEMEKKNK